MSCPNLEFTDLRAILPCLCPHPFEVNSIFWLCGPQSSRYIGKPTLALTHPLLSANTAGLVPRCSQRPTLPGHFRPLSSPQNSLLLLLHPQPSPGVDTRGQPPCGLPFPLSPFPNSTPTKPLSKNFSDPKHLVPADPSCGLSPKCPTSRFIPPSLRPPPRTL